MAFHPGIGVALGKDNLGKRCGLIIEHINLTVFRQRKGLAKGSKTSGITVVRIWTRTEYNFLLSIGLAC